MKFFTLFLLVANISLSYANDWEQLLIKVGITDSRNVSSEVYIRVVSKTFYRDSISSTDYLLKQFDSTDKKVDGVITFYKEKLNYYRRYQLDNDEVVLNKLVEPFTIDAQKIKVAKILELRDDNYALRIDSKHLKKDEDWMNKEATNLLLINHYSTLFSYYFYAYSENDVIEKLKSRLASFDVTSKSGRKKYDRLIEKTIKSARESKLVVLSYCSVSF